VPYQLHCAVVLLHGVDELDEARLLDERIDDGNELLDVAIDEEERTDDEITLERLVETDELPAPQIAPVTRGASIAPLPFTCTPNETV
jgi:hypothetical protein